VTQLELGKVRSEDQIDAAKVIENYSFVDKSRIGIFIGLTGLCSSNRLQHFKWQFSSAGNKLRFYDSIYTERYMQTPQENEKDMMIIHHQLWTVLKGRF
jgi:dipeptidyl-peptidase-4